MTSVVRDAFGRMSREQLTKTLRRTLLCASDMTVQTIRNIHMLLCPCFSLPQTVTPSNIRSQSLSLLESVGSGDVANTVIAVLVSIVDECVGRALNVKVCPCDFVDVCADVFKGILCCCVSFMCTA